MEMIGPMLLGLACATWIISSLLEIRCDMATIKKNLDLAYGNMLILRMEVNNLKGDPAPADNPDGEEGKELSGENGTLADAVKASKQPDPVDMSNPFSAFASLYKPESDVGKELKHSIAALGEQIKKGD